MLLTNGRIKMTVFDRIELEAKSVNLSEYAKAQNRAEFIEQIMFEEQLYPKDRTLYRGCVEYFDELLWKAAKSKNLI